jgi:hypothetical protein
MPFLASCLIVRDELEHRLLPDHDPIAGGKQVPTHLHAVDGRSIATPGVFHDVCTVGRYENRVDTGGTLVLHNDFALRRTSHAHAAKGGRRVGDDPRCAAAGETRFNLVSFS